MVLDRSIAPDYRQVLSVNIPDAKQIRLDNGILLHYVNVGEQDVLRLECLFYLSWSAGASLTAPFFAVKMLTEGTSGRTAAAVSEAFDRFGAFTEIVHTPDHLGIVIYCMPGCLPELLPVLKDLLQDAVFPEKEWEDLKNITTQQLRINLEQNSWVAGTRLKSGLYGKRTPYGYVQTEEGLAAAQREEARGYYQSNIQSTAYMLFLAGKVTEAETALINRYLGGIQGLTASYGATGVLDGLPELPVSERFEKKESLQSSLRVGRRMFPRTHPDYFKMLVTNEVLGGFFGSRLMKNIREEKGLTYGITSYLPMMRYHGYFMIATDVKKAFTGQTLEEIHKEIARLQEEPVPAGELELVKNVMSGEFAGSLSTAFEIGDRYRSLLLNNLPPDFYSGYIGKIRSVTALDVQEMSCKYLRREDLSEVVVG